MATRSRRKLIVVMIDGLSADYFNTHSENLPTLAMMAERGLYVRRLKSDVPATSMPGRTSMVTGVPADKHGIYGNYLFDGTTFRCANPNDVLVPTIAKHAKEIGLDVASIGYAMVRPSDTTIFHPPWWIRGWLQGSRFAKVSLDLYEGPNLAVRDPEERLSGLKTPHFPKQRSSTPDGQVLDKATVDLSSDRVLVNMAAGLACSPAPPDLILTEISSTDTIQHVFGYESDVSEWALGVADMLIASLLYALNLEGRQDDYVVAVTSDHGHSAIETAIYPNVIIPGATWQSEGATLHVATSNANERQDVVSRLSHFGAEPYESAHIPLTSRSNIATFMAPPGHSFEESPQNLPSNQPTGQPRYLSSHGLKPGSPGDDRPCFFFGAGIPIETLETAAAEEFAPTLASILGLPLEPYPSSPLRNLSSV